MAKPLFQDLPDHLLVEKFQAGNAKAFEVLFKRYYNGIKAFALKNLKDRSIAEELCMDVMLGLWKNKEGLVVETDLKPYLFKSIKNAIYNHYRKKALQTVSIDFLAENNHTISNSADYELEVNELEEIYHQQLQKLSPQRRKVYEMSRMENKSYNEIARDLNLSVNTVENYMVTTLAFFRKNLKEKANVMISLLVLIF